MKSNIDNEKVESYAALLKIISVALETKKNINKIFDVKIKNIDRVTSHTKMIV